MTTTSVFQEAASETRTRMPTMISHLVWALAGGRSSALPPFASFGATLTTRAAASALPSDSLVRTCLCEHSTASGTGMN
eukprot:CAMPEP_0115096706 /NCGR_PEP_ID=MMETSP0227-20121206/29914_1 /TAXON_ID=89957 /ORGANISM="Polarella glacialis, Strain CCMP 1383" /LENGTH=78 /DNA_ID=CAMNT_0002490553 /DNA_START=133 /DNA_END=366 /DNA_ORIENTATION=-